ASTSASDSAPRPVSLSRMPPSRSDSVSNIVSCSLLLSLPGLTRQSILRKTMDGRVEPGHDVVRARHPYKNRETKTRQTPMAPEGASRCRAVASGLTGPVGRGIAGLLRERAEPRDRGCKSQ